MTTPQIDTTATVTKNSLSSDSASDADIRALESKAAAEEAEVRRATRTTNFLLWITVVVGAFSALSALWSTRASGKLRVTENLLSNLRMARLRADALTEAARVETASNEKIDAANRESQRIETESKKEIANALDSAAKANERAQELERQNLSIRSGVANLEKEAADARRRQAEAELRIVEIRKAQIPRAFSFDLQKFADALKGKPTAKAVVIHQADDDEAALFAQQLSWALREGGWDVDAWPTAVPSIRDILRGQSLSNARSSGVKVLAKSINAGLPGDTTTPLGALRDAFSAEGSGMGAHLDETVPEGVLHIVVGPKP